MREEPAESRCLEFCARGVVDHGETPTKKKPGDEAGLKP
jgi:hypothetical protein